MDFYDSPVWLFVLWLLLAFMLISAVANMARGSCVPGSHQRYVWATIQHATMYPATVGVLLQAASFLAQGRFVWFGVMLATAASGLWNIWRFRQDDDDDWFKGAGGRVRRAARRVIASPVRKRRLI